MCASIASQALKSISTSEIGHIGLTDNHAYSVIGAKVIKSGSREVKLLKIRNPYGRKEW